jgi:tRNA (guanine37-N1)-methyltransferase
MFPGPLQYSISGRALEEKIWTLDTVQIRDFALDKHRTVDDTCFGGGAGMLLKPDVVHGAVSEAVSRRKNRPLIYLTPRGKPLDQKTVRRLALETPGVVLLCGRYEGVDQRVLDFWEFEEISIGDYILSGGEMAALTLLDACIRLIPGVIGKEESLSSESFETGLLEYPQYTRPQAWNNKIVPDVLLSGDHQKIAKWRQEEAEKITQIRRPDLWAKYLESKKVI